MMNDQTRKVYLGYSIFVIILVSVLTILFKDITFLIGGYFTIFLIGILESI